MAIVVAVYLFIAFVIPKPDAVQPAAWRIVALFFATVTGLVTEPIPGGGVVLLAVAATTLVGGATPVGTTRLLPRVGTFLRSTEPFHDDKARWRQLRSPAGYCRP